MKLVTDYTLAHITVCVRALMYGPRCLI